MTTHVYPDHRLTVAITGGIASGKSEACRYFERLGIAVADADVIARVIVEPGQPALAKIVMRFGPTVLTVDGGLDRVALRAIAFDEPQARRDLEAILHPRIRAALHEACTTVAGPYAIAAIPLLAESGGRVTYPWLDRILVIDVPFETQIRRLLARDGGTRQQAERILDAQATRKQRLAIADDVIGNDGSPSALAASVTELHAFYLKLTGP